MSTFVRSSIVVLGSFAALLADYTVAENAEVPKSLHKTCYMQSVDQTILDCKDAYEIPSFWAASFQDI